ncbi:MAG: hypothetical protein ACOC9X_01360 [bacterium]
MDRHDLWAILGVGLLGYGLWLAWPPLAFIVLGLLFVGLGLAGASLKAGDNKEAAQRRRAGE